MYFVDRKKIEEILHHFEQQLTLFKTKEDWDTAIEKAALERITHIILEAVLDVGNSMIDGFIMRDPGSYDDIIDIMEDEKVISPQMGTSLRELISYRKMVVQQYTHVNHEQLITVFRKYIAELEQFPGSVRDYLTNELGPVSAFID